jgi:hypothetical protein
MHHEGEEVPSTLAMALLATMDPVRTRGVSPFYHDDLLMPDHTTLRTATGTL